MTTPHPQVVRVYATIQEPDYDCPWQDLRSTSSTGSGVMIGPCEILTGAHVVANATFIQIQKISEPDKVTAYVKAISHDRDLAVLSVEDADFFEGIEPSEIGELCHFRDEVSVVGFPMGGEELSITEGIVSRIEVQRYSHSQRHLLAVTVDAAINAGNSGGPVFMDNKVAGIAFQKMEGADNIGEMVPAPIIRTFLQGIAQHKQPVVPGLGILTQDLENPYLRKQLGLRRGDSGVLVVGVEQGNSAWGRLQPRDVVMSIQGLSIANNGTVRYLNKYRTQYDVVLGHCYVGDELLLSVWRDGKQLDIPLTLLPSQRLVPRCQYDRRPTFFIYGGLVFQPLTFNFLESWDTWWEQAPFEFVQAYSYGLRSEERQEIVVLSQVLSDEINVGYTEFFNESVVSLNGKKPRDMVDFVQQLAQLPDHVEIVLSGGHLICLDARTVHKAQSRILSRYHIPRKTSDDLQLVTS